jgi:uncharacterized sporulation protein YeaH/YhbH (DUF444 family)
LKPKKVLLCGHSPSFKRSNPDFLLLPSKLSTLFLVKTYSRIKIVFVLLKIQLSKPIFSYLLPSKLSTLFLVKTYSRIKIVFVLLKIQLSKPIFSYLLPSKLSTLFLVKTYSRIKIVFICFAENTIIETVLFLCTKHWGKRVSFFLAGVGRVVIYIL